MKLKAELVSSFHSQFAQNQNHHQMAFLQILSLLLTILVGYGYLFKTFTNNENMNSLIEIVYFFQVISCTLLSLGMALILNMGYCFRRDQVATCLIRRRAGVLSDDDKTTYFSKSFDPIEKSGIFDWLPGFQFIFFTFLFIIKLLLIFGTMINTYTKISIVESCNFMITMSVVLSLISIGIDLYIFTRYRCKWISYAVEWKAKHYPVSVDEGI